MCGVWLVTCRVWLVVRGVPTRGDNDGLASHLPSASAAWWQGKQLKKVEAVPAEAEKPKDFLAEINKGGFKLKKVRPRLPARCHPTPGGPSHRHLHQCCYLPAPPVPVPVPGPVPVPAPGPVPEPVPVPVAHPRSRASRLAALLVAQVASDVIAQQKSAKPAPAGNDLASTLANAMAARRGAQGSDSDDSDSDWDDD